jgi:hypothetical protein
MQVLQLFTGLITPSPHAICIKCHDFERPMNSRSHFVSLSIIYVMTIILSFSDAVSQSSVMICCIAVSSLVELGDLFSQFPVVADAAARRAGSFSRMSAMPVVAGVACLDAVQLRRSALVR